MVVLLLLYLIYQPID
jgi:hypothetical protein